MFPWIGFCIHFGGREGWYSYLSVLMVVVWVLILVSLSFEELDIQVYARKTGTRLLRRNLWRILVYSSLGNLFPSPYHSPPFVRRRRILLCVSNLGWALDMRGLLSHLEVGCRVSSPEQLFGGSSVEIATRMKGLSFDR